MEWIIKKNATLPIFQIEIAKDGRSDFGRNQDLLNTTFYISLYDEVSKKFKVTSKPCYVTYSSSTVNSEEIVYFLNYQFTNRETNLSGRYSVQISAQDTDGVIVLPLKEKVYVSVLESFSLDYTPYSNNYIIDRPCCDNNYPPDVIICELFIVSESGIDLITEDGLFITNEFNSCLPLACEIALVSEGDVLLQTEYGEYLVDELNDC